MSDQELGNREIPNVILENFNLRTWKVSNLEHGNFEIPNWGYENFYIRIFRIQKFENLEYPNLEFGNFANQFDIRKFQI